LAVKLCPIWVGTQFFNSAGNVLSGGKISQYLAGTTTTQATFTDSTGITQNANPIVLDSTGRYSSQIWLTTGISYKLVLTDSNNNTILTEDNLSAVNDVSVSAATEWVSQSTPTFVSGTSFTVTGNQTTTFQVGMRVKATINAGFIYGKITSSTFGAVTTVVVSNDSGALDNTLSAVSVGLLGETNPSVPSIINYALTLGGANTHSGNNTFSGTNTFSNGLTVSAGLLSGINYAMSAQPLSTLYNSATFSSTSQGTIITYSAGINQGGMSQNAANGTITVPNTGTYLIYCIGHVKTSGAATEAAIYWGRNATIQTRLISQLENSTTIMEMYSSGMTIRQLTANDVISLIANGSSPAPSQTAQEFGVVQLF
jgi:hypothetical protein